MSANPSGGLTPIFTAWVDWKPKSPNQLLHRHWRVTQSNSRAAKQAWWSSLSSLTEKGFSTTITAHPHSNLFVTEFQNHLGWTMETVASGGNVDKLKHGAEKEST